MSESVIFLKNFTDIVFFFNNIELLFTKTKNAISSCIHFNIILCIRKIIFKCFKTFVLVIDIGFRYIYIYVLSKIFKSPIVYYIYRV
jgi:hypothetical protein